MSLNTSSIGVLIFYAYSYYETVSSFNLLSRASPSYHPSGPSPPHPSAPPAIRIPIPSPQPLPKLAPVRDPLPFEILVQIAGYLDTRSALAFARVAKDFTAPAEPAIWRDIVLNLPDMWRTRKADELEADLVRCGLPLPDCYSGDYSEGGLISPAMYSSRLHGIAWENRVHLVEHLYWDKIQKLLSAGAAGTRRWKWVESLTLAFHDQPADDLVALLGECSKTIKRLHILEAGSVSLQRGAMEWELFVRSTQLAADHTCLSFTSLTHLTVDRGGIAFIETIPLLISISPQLVSLVFHAEKQSSSGSPSSLLIRFPYRLVGPTTGLRELDISLDNISYYDSGYDPLETVGDLIEKSPLVERLRVAIVSVTSGFFPFSPSRADVVLLRRVRNHDRLTDLHWSWECRGSWNMGVHPSNSGDLATLPSLRRLSVVLQDGKLPSHASMPSSPNLEHLYVHCEVRRSGGNDRMFYLSDSPGIPIVDADFAIWLRSNPNLRYIHFHLGEYIPIDISRTLDKHGWPRIGTTLVRSMRRGDRELLHARFYVRRIEVKWAEQEAGLGSTNGIVFGDPRSWESFFRGLAPKAPPAYVIHRRPAWYHFTEFEGAAVPLAVIRQMRAVEGVGKEDDWGRRGVEVGEAAWKVLTDWRESLGV